MGRKGGLPLRHREQAGRVSLFLTGPCRAIYQGAPGASKVTFPLVEIVPSETRC